MGISAKANLQAEGVFEDIGNWFENDFVDFWTEDVPGAFEDAGEWLATDFVDFFQTDFVEFWEEDFVDFWTEDVPEIATAAGDWLGQAAVDVYEGLGDAAEWIIDGDNWEAAFDTLTSSIGLLFQGEFEESWDLFTNPEAYLGEYEEIQEVKEKMGEYAKQLLAMNLDHCSSSHMSVPVLGRTQSGYTVTSDFNHLLRQNEIPDAAIYTPLGRISGPNAVHISARACESVDCMHPCYGQDKMGACNKCAMHMMQHKGERHAVCDLCVV